MEMSRISDYLLEVYASILQIPTTSASEGEDVADSPTPHVTLENCTTYLDRRLLALSWLELRDFFFFMQKISQNIVILRDLSAECRHNGINLTAPQSLKVSKLCEMLDSLLQITIQTPIFGEAMAQSVPTEKTISSYLPDIDYLQAYIYKTKTKLKTIEEMAASKKTDTAKFKFSGKVSLQSRLKDTKVFDLTIIRKEIKLLQENLQVLEQYLIQYEHLFTYFASIRKYIHRYYQEIVLAAATLPSLESFEEKMKEENEVLLAKEQDYNSARSQKSLVQAALARKEMLVIEQETKKMLLENLPVHQIISCLQFVENNAEDEYSPLIPTLHLQLLQGLICGSEDDLISIFSSKEVEDIEAAFRALGSYIVRRFDYIWQDDDEDDENDDEPDKEAQEVDGHLGTAWIDQINNFELDLFLGYVQTWKEKESILDETIRSESFESDYASLQEVRQQYSNSAVSFEKVMMSYKNMLDQHMVVNREVAQFKDRFSKIVQSELNQDVEINSE